MRDGATARRALPAGPLAVEVHREAQVGELHRPAATQLRREIGERGEGARGRSEGKRGVRDRGDGGGGEETGVAESRRRRRWGAWGGCLVGCRCVTLCVTKRDRVR